MHDMKARQEIYNAARELMFAVEPPIETDNRVFFAVSSRHISKQELELTTFDSTLAWPSLKLHPI
jgi:hypothetical protein